MHVDPFFPNIGNAVGGTVRRVFDVVERLVELTAKEREKTQNFAYAYNPENGLIEAITNLESGLVTAYAYDLMDRRTNISYRTASGGLIRSLDYQFDAIGMITNQVSGDGSQETVRSFEYDSINRLVGETRTVGQTLLSAQVYSYDLAGNRLGKTSGSVTVSYALGTGNRLASWAAVSTNGFAGMARVASVSGSASETIGTNPRWGQRSVSNSATQVAVSPLIDGTNYFGTVELQPGTQTVVAAISDVAGNVGYASNSVALSVVTNAQYLSDAAGCLTHVAYSGSGGFSGTISLEWDERYRLEEVTTKYTNHTKKVQYSYDVLGRRTSCSVGSASQTNTTFFVYSGNQVVADLDGSGNLLRSYVWGPGIDNLLAMTVHPASTLLTNSTPLTLYPIKDHQNSVLAFTDASCTVVESYEYDAWGRTRVFDSSGAEMNTSNIGNRYLFQGREIDWATGFYYFRARWYDPVSGRWLSKDPVGISGGFNQYVFCENNPVNFVDPLGLRWLGGADDGIQVGRAGTIISDEPGKQGEWIEEHVPAMETMGYIHDDLVGALTGAGVPDIVANVPTMLPAYGAAVITETVKTPGYIFGAIKGLFDKDEGSDCKE